MTLHICGASKHLIISSDYTNLTTVKLPTICAVTNMTHDSYCLSYLVVHTFLYMVLHKNLLFLGFVSSYVDALCHLSYLRAQGWFEMYSAWLKRMPQL
jgi:hypothetical protein